MIPNPNFFFFVAPFRERGITEPRSAPGCFAADFCKTEEMTPFGFRARFISPYPSRNVLTTGAVVVEYKCKVDVTILRKRGIKNAGRLGKS